jgi:hypothetical protein
VLKLTLYNSASLIRIFQGGIEGTLDYFSGSWLDDENVSGIFNGIRTL